MLGYQVYLRTAGYLIQNIMQACVDVVIRANEIDMRCSSGIRIIFMEFQKEIPSLFLPVGDSPEFAEFAEMGTNLIEKYVKSWSSIIALITFLDCSLTKLVDILPSKIFCCFTDSEIIGLIHAVFEESPTRDALIKSIYEGQLQK